nr:ribonuclease H-like domain-containing protein [Tanacetum cinerariifolium]
SSLRSSLTMDVVTISVMYVFTSHIPEDGNDSTVEQLRYRASGIMMAMFNPQSHIPEDGNDSTVEQLRYRASGIMMAMFNPQSRYKARLMANGSTQLEGVDVDETVSLVIKPGTIRTKKYVVKMLEKAHMVNYNSSRTPVDNESKLRADGDPISDLTLYRSLAEPHFSNLKRVLRYVRGTLDYGLQLFSSSTTDLVAYSNADWAGCPTTRRSTSEAEYRGVASAVAETCKLRNLLLQHQRTKHIEIDIHFVRDLVADGQVRVLHVPFRYQFADIFTKGSPSALFEDFHTSLSGGDGGAYGMLGDVGVKVEGNLIDGKSISNEMRPYGSTMLSTRARKFIMKVNSFVTQPGEIYTYHFGQEIYTYHFSQEIYTYHFGQEIYTYHFGLEIYTYHFGQEIYTYLFVQEIYTGAESEKHDTSSRSGNDTHAKDADIKPVNDKELIAEKCVFKANHDACLTRFLKEVNSRVKVLSLKTRNSNKPVEPKFHTQKPGRQIVTGHRWVPTGKTFTSSITKVDCEPINGSNEDITNLYECDQTFNVNEGTLNLTAGYGLQVMTPATLSTRLVSNPGSQQPYIPPNRDDWDCLFQPMFDEYFNPPTIFVSPVQEAAAPRDEVSADSPVSISISQDAPSTSIPSSQAQENSQ